MKKTFEQLVKSTSGTDYWLVSHAISRPLYIDFSRKLKNVGLKSGNQCCTLILTTFGGDPHAAYRIARALRHHYKKLRIVVPSFCKSAGTLICISADELAIADTGELGPLDLQVRKSSELQESSSVMDSMQALKAILNHTIDVFRKTLVDVRYGGNLSTKLAGDFACKIATGVAAPLYSQIDPIKIGEMQRKMGIAHEYGQRLSEYGKNLKEEAIVKLSAGYPSHDFVIDRKEAANLFNKVTNLSAAESELCDKLWEILYIEGDELPIYINALCEDKDAINEQSGTENPKKQKTTTRNTNQASNNKSNGHAGNGSSGIKKGAGARRDDSQAAKLMAR